jgi:hypothetical protein
MGSPAWSVRFLRRACWNARCVSQAPPDPRRARLMGLHVARSGAGAGSVLGRARAALSLRSENHPRVGNRRNQVRCGRYDDCTRGTSGASNRRRRPPRIPPWQDAQRMAKRPSPERAGTARLRRKRPFARLLIKTRCEQNRLRSDVISVRQNDARSARGDPPVEEPQHFARIL